jgi:hypothetical protein
MQVWGHKFTMLSTAASFTIKKGLDASGLKLYLLKY